MYPVLRFFHHDDFVVDSFYCYEIFSRTAFYDRLDLCVLGKDPKVQNMRFTFRVAEKSYVPTRIAGTIGADCCSAAWVIPIVIE